MIHKLFIQIFVISITIVACNESNKNRAEASETANNGFENEETTNYSFKSKSQVEQLIKLNSPIFLSFWIGMTEEDCEEVILYLLEQDKIGGLIYHYKERDYVPLSSENIRNPEFTNEGKQLFYYLTPKSESFKCQIDLTFDDENEQKSLTSLSLGFIEGANLQVFNDCVDLYKTKFGNPTIKRNKSSTPDIEGKTYRRYSFESGDKLIDIEYNSEHKNWLGSNSPNQIHIYYGSKVIKKIESDKFSEQVRIRMRTKKENDEKAKKNTLNDIAPLLQAD